MDASSAAQDRSGWVPEGTEPVVDLSPPGLRPGGAPGPPAGEEAEPVLERLGLDQLRALRRETLEQEADLSYLRRLLQGRMDILRAELDRRPGTALRTAAGVTGRRAAPCWTGCRPS